MTTTFVLKFMILISLFIGTTASEECDLFCDARNVHDKLDCGPIECPSEEYVLEPGVGKCGLCSACVRYAQYGEDCERRPSISPEQQELRIYKSTKCAKGLQCTSRTKKCELGDSGDESPGTCFEEIEDLKKLTTEPGLTPDVLTWVWKPQCYSSGHHKLVQCKGQKCYCTQRDGERIFGSANQYLEDGSSGDMNCKCSMTALKLAEGETDTADYDHVVCQTNGNYKPLQCIRDLCFCVNETSGEVDGVVLPKTLISILPCYDENSYKASFEQRCQVQRDNEEKLARYYQTKGFPLNTVTLTKCDPDGTYMPKQCNDRNCYCAKPEDGQAINPNYMVKAEEGVQLSMGCHCLRDRFELGPVSQQILCETDGDYKPAICSGSICNCLDKDGQQNTIQKNLAQWIKEPCSLPSKPENERRIRICYLRLIDNKCDN